MAGNVSQTEQPYRHSQVVTDKAKTQGVSRQAIEILCLDKVAVDVRFVLHWVYRDQYQGISVNMISVRFLWIHAQQSYPRGRLKKDYFLTHWEAGKAICRLSWGAKRINYKRLKSFIE